MKNSLISFLMLIIIVLSSCKDNSNIYEKKPLRYFKDEKIFKGDGYYKNDTLEIAIAFNSKRDTILIDSFKHNVTHGTSREFFDNGKMKKIGKYDNGDKVDIWKEFYIDGSLKAYEYWGSKEKPIYYSKKYKTNGQLDRFKLPIDHFTLENDSVFYVNKEYELYIELLHSEYDSVHSYGIYEENKNLSILADTVGFFGNKIYLKFKPLKVGNDTIKGVYSEADGLKITTNENEDENITYQEFSIPILIEDYR